MSNTASSHKLPGAGAVLSAVALYAFCRGFLYGLAFLVIPLLELLRGHPRLSALVILGFWLSPIPLIAIGHAALSATLDRLDPESGERGSAWVGLYSWLVAVFATVTTVFVALLLDPRQPEPDMFAQLSETMSLSGGSLALHTIVWILIATLLFHAEQRARRRRTSS